jgi:hypothetical protein
MSSALSKNDTPGSVDDRGKFTPHEGWVDHFRRCFNRHCGYDVIVSVKRKRSPVSKKARGYYYAVVLKECLEEMGLDVNKENLDQLHDTMKAKFTSEVMVGKDGNEELWIRGTSGEDSPEYAQFVDKVIRWANTFLGIEISEPNPYWKDRPKDYEQPLSND